MERKLITAQPDELGDAKTGSKSQIQHRTIARTASDMRIWRIKQCPHFFVREVVDQFLIRSFDRDRLDATDLIEATRQPILEEAEEGFDRTEPGITSLGQVMTLRLDVLKEDEDQRRIQLFDRSI